MAFLTPDALVTAKIGGKTLTIKQKITPDGARATKYIASYVQKGDLVKPNKKLSDGTGVPKGVTVHNTGDIVCANGTTPAEQYARATYPNGNMNGVAVHFWVWHSDIWQQLREDERGWHAADGSSRRTDHRGGKTGGNLDTISIEAIGSDPETEETLAYLVAWLCEKHKLDPALDVYTHNYWMHGKDSVVSGAKKNCPIYILPHWSTFLGKVKTICAADDVAPQPTPQPSASDLLPTGTVVIYTGNVHYTSANATTSKKCTGGKAKITAISKGSKHPYHLVRITGSSCNVYGWVDADEVTPFSAQAEMASSIEVGSKVRVKNGALTYDGRQLKSFVYDTIYDVISIAGDRVVIGLGKAVTAAVKASDLYLNGADKQPTVPDAPAPSQSTSNAEKIWDFLRAKGLNPFAVAGLMGNLNAESALNPKNLQQTYEKKLGMTDASYTEAVDNGTYTNFVKDSAGYGLAQWTYWSRKQNLLDFAKSAKASIGDLDMQLSFLWKEIQGYSSVMSVLKSATSVREASDVVLTKYERPADMGESVQVKRASFGQSFYNKFKDRPVQKSEAPTPFSPYKVKVKIDDLNIRKGPGTNHDKWPKPTGVGVFTIVEEADGKGATKWGLLKSYSKGRDGWISLDFASKI